jgi:hypothetical protein
MARPVRSIVVEVDVGAVDVELDVVVDAVEDVVPIEVVAEIDVVVVAEPDPELQAATPSTAHEARSAPATRRNAECTRPEVRALNGIRSPRIAPPACRKVRRLIGSRNELTMSARTRCPSHPPAQKPPRSV